MNFTRFMKQNQIKKENTKYPATKTLTDEKGEPLLWEIKPVTTRENDDIINDCTYEVPITGKPGMYRAKMDQTKYRAKLICASVVSPDLNNKELLDSYGVMGPADLIKEMVSDVGEYNKFFDFINEYNNLIPFQEEVDEAKN